MNLERQITITTPRNFKVINQLVSLTAIDFENRTFVGYTEIAIIPLTPQVRNIRLNCSKQCRISQVTVQAQVTNKYGAKEDETYHAAFLHDDPITNALNGLDESTTTPSEYASTLSNSSTKTDAERGNGELMVKFPSEIYAAADEQKLIRIAIDYVVERPSAGVQFVCGPLTGVDDRLEKDQQQQQQQQGQSQQQQQQPLTSMRDRGFHVYTSKTNDYQARHWMPCVDSPGELCPWKLEITCDLSMTAVCSGELVEVVYTSDLRRKTYYYVLPSPTAACHVGFAVGPFEIYVHSEMNELSNFCLPQLSPLLKVVCRNLHKMFEFYEELLSARYPYGSYKQVFVDELPGDQQQPICYASMTIMSTKLLFYQKVIEQPPLTRIAMASGIAHQFFGCFVTTSSWRDAWVCHGLVRYISALYVQRFFGHNEYTYGILDTLRLVVDYESRYGGVTLLPKADEGGGSDSRMQTDAASPHFDIHCPLTCSPMYIDALFKKSHLVFRILEKKLGKELLFQVLNKLLSVATHGSQQKYQPALWSNLLLSTDTFFKCVSNVTGQDMQSIVEQWVTTSGHAEFVVSFQFNRKRNMIELEIRQDLTAVGAVKYVGPIIVVAQELDGSFTHTLQIDDSTSRHDIQCHSKARRQRKRKIPLWTGEEVDMDLTALDADSPLLWLRFDPDLMTVSRVQMQQPDYQWQYQLRHERDAMAQFAALEMLSRFPNPQTKQALVDVIESDQTFYRVRCEACSVLTEVQNKLAAAWTGPQPLFVVFRRMFGSKSSSHIPRLNNFTNFQNYFLMKSIILAAAQLRGPNGLCPNEVLQFLFDLAKYNNNATNKFYDDAWRACIHEAMGRTIEPGQAIMGVFGHGQRLQLSQSNLKRLTSEITLALNLERIKPSFDKLLTKSCLRALVELHKSNLLLQDATVFGEFVRAGLHTDVRLTAADCLIEFVRVTKHAETLLKIFKSMKIKKDQDWSSAVRRRKSMENPTAAEEDRFEMDNQIVRWRLAENLCRRPLFTSNDSTSLRTKEIYDGLMDLLLNGGLQYDTRLISALSDAITIMFGKDQPSFSSGTPEIREDEQTGQALSIGVYGGGEQSSTSTAGGGGAIDQQNRGGSIDTGGGGGASLGDVMPFQRSSGSTNIESTVVNVFHEDTL